MTVRLSPAELHTLQRERERNSPMRPYPRWTQADIDEMKRDGRGEELSSFLTKAARKTVKEAEARQLSLFKGRRQRGSLPPPAPEFSIQCMVADDLRRFAHPEWQWCHVPNGGLRNKITAYQLKRAGVKPGWPDMLLLDPFGRPALP